MRLEEIACFVRDYLMDSGKKQIHDPWGPKYRWEHTLRVAHWAQKLAGEERIDVERSVAAALFHDISHFVTMDYRNHGERSAEIARDFMLQKGFSSDYVEAVAYAVKSHVGEKDPKTLEAKILQDADTLDRFGYLRLLMVGKTSDLNLEKMENEILRFLEHLEKVERGDFGSMWTEIGKTTLQRLINTYKDVYAGMLHEIQNTEASSYYISSQPKQACQRNSDCLLSRKIALLDTDAVTYTSAYTHILR